MDPEQFRRKLAGIVKQYHDGNQFGFRREGLLKSLRAAKLQSKSFGEDSIEHATVCLYLGLLDDDAGSSLEQLQLALDVHDRTGFIEQAMEWLARVRIASNLLALGEDSDGLARFEDLERRVRAAADVSAEARLETMHRIGFELHEHGRFREALAHNERVLQAAAAWLTAGTPPPLDTLRNLAENHYELDQFDEARRCLRDVIEHAQQAQDLGVCSQAHFKLGVLAHEAGDDAGAESHLQTALAVARQSGDAVLISDAEAHLEELQRRKQSPAADRRWR